MKKNTKAILVTTNKQHDPENWQFVAGHHWDELYMIADGKFVLREFLRYLNGRKLAPEEKPTDATRDQWENGFRTAWQITSLTPREAMSWCIKTQLPSCFQGALLEHLPKIAAT
jgi:hypothetical protein